MIKIRAVATDAGAATEATAIEECQMQAQLPPLCGANILVTVLPGKCRVRCQAWAALRATVRPFGIRRPSVLQLWEVRRKKRRRKRRRSEPPQDPRRRHLAPPFRTGGRRCGSKAFKAACGLECPVCKDRCQGRCRGCGLLAGHSQVPIQVAATVGCQVAQAHHRCRLLRAAVQDTPRLQAGTSPNVTRLQMDPICRSSSSRRWRRLCTYQRHS